MLEPSCLSIAWDLAESIRLSLARAHTDIPWHPEKAGESLAAAMMTTQALQGFLAAERERVQQRKEVADA